MLQAGEGNVSNAAPKVFISYSHDSESHMDRVLDLAKRLRDDGIDAELDQYEMFPDERWPRWCNDRIQEADFVLLVCTEAYHRRVSGKEEVGKGFGVCWEASIIQQSLYDTGSVSKRFIPVLFTDASIQHIPIEIRGFSHFVVDTSDGYDGLYRVLTDQPRVRKPALGKLRSLPPKERKSSDVAATSSATRPRVEDVSADFAVFRDIDAPWCPEMVALPAGQFLMGSLEGDKDAETYEKPERRVRINHRVAVGRYPLTVVEYEQFVEATDRTREGGLHCWTGSEWTVDDWKSWQNPGFQQTGRHPVTGVSWHDARAYVEWLRQETGKPYRLVREAEWEYACRAGTTTRYSCGDVITERDANFDLKVGRTTEVGLYPPNAWGLCDMHGNVWEWVEDVWHENYEGAPDDGRAWTKDGDSRVRVLRGGCWDNGPGDVRSAVRIRGDTGCRGNSFGFRVARALA
jgi:formylglycine-generating enzyme required for sulfatase activity